MNYAIKETDQSFNRKYSVSTHTYKVNANEDCIKPNWHESFEFVTVNTGSLIFTIDNRIYEVEPKTIIAIGPNLLHSAKSGNTGCEFTSISFDHKYLLDDSVYEQTLRNSITNHIVSISTVIRDENALTLFCELLEVSNKRIPSQPIIEKGYACIFFSYLLENFSQTQEKHNTGNTKFDAILDYISQNFTRHITTKSIAERFSYNKSYFCRKFLEVTNLTPTEYILKLRIEHSQNLISTTTMPLSDIAQQCGFSSYPYFSSKFKEKIGISPADWREKFLMNNKIS